MEDIQRELPFAAVFPLPFRVLFLTGAGILGWATNLHGMEWLGVDVVTALELDSNSRARSPLPSRLNDPLSEPHTHPHYGPIYKLFVKYSLWWFAAWCLFRYASHSDLSLVDMFGYIPTICSLFLLCALICPFDILQRRHRDAFLKALKRCLFPPPDVPIYFSDVILADIFTSYAKVLGDVWLSMCMQYAGGSLLRPPTQSGLLRWILPTIMSVPYMARLRQCIIEYQLNKHKSQRSLFNAIKYASSFPVIYLSAAQRIAESDIAGKTGASAAEQPSHSKHVLFRLWLLAAAVNSLYSFWWDVTNDWGLDFLRFNPKATQHVGPTSPGRDIITESPVSSRSRSPPIPLNRTRPSANAQNREKRHADTQTGLTAHLRSMHWGLRSTLLYPITFYPMAIFLDLILRLTWSLKLSAHLHSQSEGTVVIFYLELAELVRRWIWVFLRVEWELIKKAGEGHDGLSDSYNYMLLDTLTESDGTHGELRGASYSLERLKTA